MVTYLPLPEKDRGSSTVQPKVGRAASGGRAVAVNSRAEKEDPSLVKMTIESYQQLSALF